MHRKSRLITFSLPPELAERVEQCKRDDCRTTSELLREALRCYFEEREWRRSARFGNVGSSSASPTGKTPDA